MIDCIEETGKTLNLNNEGIVKYLCSIEEERRHLEIIIQKQYQERKQIESEIERLTYKLCLINKSLSMRIKAKNNYDKTIEEIKAHYEQLVDSSNKLRQIVEKTQQELDDIMNKKTGTSSGTEGEKFKMLYAKSSGDQGRDSCVCPPYPEVPTKELSQKLLPVSSKSQKNSFQSESLTSREITKSAEVPQSTRSSKTPAETITNSAPQIADTLAGKIDVKNPVIQSMAQSLDATYSRTAESESEMKSKMSEKHSSKMVRPQYSMLTPRQASSIEQVNPLRQRDDISNNDSTTTQM